MAFHPARNKARRIKERPCSPVRPASELAQHPGRPVAERPPGADEAEADGHRDREKREGAAEASERWNGIFMMPATTA